MDLYSGSIADKRVRRYLPCQRILACAEAENSECLINNREIQIFLWGKKQPVCRLNPGGYLLIDFGTELHGGIRLLSMNAGRIRLRFGESAGEAMLQPDMDHAVHDTDLQLPANGMLEYGNTAFRFVRIDNMGSSPLVFQNILAVALFLDMSWDGSFTSSDERLNRIWYTGAYTVLLNMQDYIYDGAKRDRLPWMGDLHPEQRTILSVFPDSSLIAKTLDYLKEHTPAGCWMNDIVTYSMWFIICHWEYYWHTGNLDYLLQQKDYIADLLERFAAMTDDSGLEKIVGFRFIDWPTESDPEATHAGLQGLLYWMFQCGLKISAAVDDKRSEALCRKLLPKIAANSPDCGKSKSAAALQCISTLADRRDVLLKNPLEGISTFYGGYVLHALPTGTALMLIRNYWGAMLDYGATTFWEDFDLNWTKNCSPISELPVAGKDDLHADFGAYCYKGLRHSLCHGWASGPTSFLSKRITGLDFLTPGGRKAVIKPDLSDLEFVSVSCPTPHGIIKVTLERGRKADISAPSGVDIVTGTV